MTRIKLTLAFAFVAGAFAALAQDTPPTRAGAAAARAAAGKDAPPVISAPNRTPGTPSPQEIVKVVITPSRVSIARDGSYGVFADIENISSDPITLRSAETVLVVQPEVSHPNACVDWAYGIFPTQTSPKQNAMHTPDPGADTVVLPNEHYKVFWDLSGSKPNGTSCVSPRSIADYLGFVPGDYVFAVEGVAYSTPVEALAPAATPGAAAAATTPKQPVRHTFSETTILKVGISQIATAFAAFMGALLAYVVVSLQPGHDFDRFKPELPAKDKWRTVLAILRNAISAGLLGAAVTIVASRLSDTQFPVKVSVNDFWGSLTIGFVAYFIGTKFIVSLAAKFGGPPTTIPPAPAIPPAVPAPAAPAGNFALNEVADPGMAAAPMARPIDD